jgi:hypothetical protein
MNATEEQIRMATKLYEVRDAAKRLLGNSYATRINLLRAPISAIQRRDNCDPLTAATTIAKAAQANEWEKIFIVAAAVEMIEPSTAARTIPE